MADLKAEIALLWIEVSQLPSAFEAVPFPPRAARGPLAPLVQSLRAVGCLSPILARPHGARLQVICGHRRLLAAQPAGLSRLPVLIRELSDEECRRVFEHENCVREPLTGAETPGRPAAAAAAMRMADIARPAAVAPEPLRPPVPLQTEPVRTTEPLRTPAPEPIAARMPDAESIEPVMPRQLELIPAAASSIEPVPAAAVARESREAPALPAASGPAPDMLPDRALIGILRRMAAFFRSIALTRAIPVVEAEEIATQLIELSPVRRGKDLRGFTWGALEDWQPGHSLVVAGLGIHLAESLEWTPGQVKKFALACLLHDVGMLFVPRPLLFAPKPLTPAQRTVVERHPEIGREIIQASRAWGAQIHLVAQDHHERWDGSGYPAKKRGKDVDLPARIVGFLDCFAALISRRPHRPALLYSQAYHFMASATELGVFDPAILVHFRNIFSEVPVGSSVRLADGRAGRLVAKDPRNPSRHRVVFYGPPDAEDGPPQWVEAQRADFTEIPPPIEPSADENARRLKPSLA